MSVNTGVRKARGTEQRLIELIRANEVSFIESLKPISSESVSSFGGLGGGGNQVASRPLAGQGSFLPLDGSLPMIGPVSYDPEAVFIIDGVLDLSKELGRYKGRIIVKAQTGNTDRLDFIKGARHAGQQLQIQTVAGDTITVSHDLSGNGSAGKNIRNPSAVDFVIDEKENLMLVFDSIQNQWTFGDSALFTSGDFVRNPMVTDLDAANFLITNVASLRLSESFGAGTPAANNIYTDVLNSEMRLQARSTDSIVFLQGDLPADRFATFTKNLIDLSLILGSVVQLNALLVKNISEFRETMTLNTTIGGLPKPSFIPSAIVAGSNNGGDLGTTTIPFNNLNVEQIRLREGEIIIDIPSLTRVSNNMILNVDTGQKFFFDFRGIIKWDMSSSSLTGDNIILSNTLTLNDQLANPGANGQFARNALDVKVFSGGTVRDFSDMAEKGKTNTFIAINTFTKQVNLNDDVTLGDSIADIISILGRIGTDFVADSDNVKDIGIAGQVWRNIFLGRTIDLEEGFAVGFAPSGQTNRAIIFTRPDGAGKTLLRVKFQTGTSVLIASEP